ncbi:protein DpdE [Burkholderia cenocepacia]|uniref:protein DpdE n=1 Tax=Burkholderia cenocepacia TaxID=95486 RepID=UPI002ABDACCE|nr:protein DpdE [Burkholderia cenocepacia]
MVAVHLAVGDFVQINAVPYADWGIGKFLGATAGIGRVQYFDAPGAELPPAVEISLTNIKPVRLPAETRVYRRHSTGRWQVGRLIDGENAVFFVQFPNRDAVNIDAADLQVRWNRPLRDPLPLLINEATETPFLSDARSAFTRQVALQYMAASGITAALSQPIELVDYQFEVVRRVLTDPVQRYLLADEVGLGKTIEACIIIRQYFLDAPESARAVVLAPPALVWQWRNELSARFGLANFLDDFLHVVSHDDPEELEETLKNAGLLVVDEAHHLSRLSNEREVALFRLLQVHAHKIPRLLLLSATPVLSNPEGFLRVLHLLDPLAFPLDDINGFKRRIATRQIIAEVVAALVPENLWSLSGELERLREAYGEDVVLMNKVEALHTIIDTFPDEEDEAYLEALADLKTHLVESYRLHRRMLRNRRKSVQWATPGRAGLKRVSFSSEGADRWRHRIEELRLWLNGVDALPDALRVALFESAVNPRRFMSMRALLEQHSVRDVDALDIASALDNSAHRMRDGHERFDALLATVERLLAVPDAQVVVFCSERADADRAAVRLRCALDTQVVLHEVRVDHDDDEDRTLPWQQFLSAPQKVRVLVCDARAEEGINLHGGKKIAVHFDMPGSPNRCEQRLGRLDRFGAGDPIVSYALQDEANPDEVAWIDTLDTGWQVFERSVASLQYLIESALQTLSQEWFARGTPAIQEHQAALAGPDGLVERERRQIDLQDALDALGEQEADAIDRLDEREQAWREWRAAFYSFAREALKFEIRYEGPRPMNDDSDEVFKVGYALHHGVPQTLIPLDNYLRTFLQSLDSESRTGSSRSLLSHPYVFRRQNALTRAAKARGVRVLRIGDPLVTALEQFCEHDDRGRAFAMWRVDREYEVSDPSGADLYFRFDFVIRPAALIATLDGRGSEAQSIVEQALARKAQALFAPVFVRVWVDGAGTIVTDPPERVASPYRKAWQCSHRDYNLNSDRWRNLPLAVQSSWLRNWPVLCTEARRHAETAALQSEACQHQVKQALAALDRELRLRDAQSESRLARLAGVQRRRELSERAEDDAVYATIRSALVRPDVDLDVAGAVFLASDNPFEQ